MSTEDLITPNFIFLNSEPIPWKSKIYVPIKKLSDQSQTSVWLAWNVHTESKVTIKIYRLRNIVSSVGVRHLQSEKLSLETFKSEIQRSLTSLDSDCFLRFKTPCLRVPYILETFHEIRDTTRASTHSSSDGETAIDEEDTNFYIVYKYVDGFPLSENICKGIPEKTVKQYSFELAHIIGAVHERGFVYRDLKASNVIVEKDGRLRLIDFGLSKYIGSRGRTKSICGTFHAVAPEVVQCDRLLREKSQQNLQDYAQSLLTEEYKELTQPTRLTTGRRSLSKMHPSPSHPMLTSANEAGAAASYGMEVDWWGLGTLIYEMIYSAPPFGYLNKDSFSDNKITKKIFQSPVTIEFPKQPVISEDCKNIIYTLLQSDPERRLGHNGDASEVLSHPWFDGLDMSIYQSFTDTELSKIPYYLNMLSMSEEFEDENNKMNILKNRHDASSSLCDLFSI